MAFPIKVAPAQCAANSDVKMVKAPPVESPIQAYAVRDLITQKRSPNQPVYIDVAQERSQVF